MLRLRARGAWRWALVSADVEVKSERSINDDKRKRPRNDNLVGDGDAEVDENLIDEAVLWAENVLASGPV